MIRLLNRAGAEVRVATDEHAAVLRERGFRDVVDAPAPEPEQDKPEPARPARRSRSK